MLAHNILSVLLDKSISSEIDMKYIPTCVTRKVLNHYKYPVSRLVSDDIESDSKILSGKYDMIIVSENNVFDFLPIFHKCVYIFIIGTTFIEYKSLLEKLYSYKHKFHNGFLYENTLHSIVFPTENLTIREQTFIRDKPFYFIQQILSLAKNVIPVKTIIEIGTCRKVLNHPIDEIDPICCNDSHSTFFWCTLENCTIYTVDISPSCKFILEQAYNDNVLKMGENSSLRIRIQDGLQFLTTFASKKKNPTVDFLFLDAWDVIKGTRYAEHHLDAYLAIKHKLSDKCIIAIDDTDIANGGKGRLVVPQLLLDGYIILYKGRHTVLIRGGDPLLKVAFEGGI